MAPSNPVVSVGPILALPGVRDALRAANAPVVAVSPIVGGAAIKGPAAPLMRAVGMEVSALGVARAYADFLDGWVVDDADAGLRLGAAQRDRLHVRSRPLLMSSVAAAADIAGTALDLALSLPARSSPAPV